MPDKGRPDFGYSLKSNAILFSHFLAGVSIVDEPAELCAAPRPRLASGGAPACRAALGDHRTDAARYRRRDAARADARLHRGPGLVRPAPAADQPAGRVRLALVAPDRCGTRRVAVDVRPRLRARDGGAADAHG